MEPPVREGLIAAAGAEGYAGKMGFQVVEISTGRAVVEMLPQGEDENIFGYVHGGALCALIDEAFQLACNSHGTVAVALNLSVAFHSPAFKGVRLRAEAVEVNCGRRTGTYMIRVVDHLEKLIASCQATAYRKDAPLPFLHYPIEKE
jgi:acyl-CoA thioesterase